MKTFNLLKISLALITVLFHIELFANPANLSDTNLNDINRAGPLIETSSAPNNFQLPEVPLIYRNVTGIINDEFTRPHLPPIRPTKDGRLGVISQIYNDGVPLVLMNPEKIHQSVLHSARGAKIISQDEPYIISNEDLKAPLGFQHGTLCEPNSSYSNRKQNPYSCGINGQQDCYDLIFIGGESLDRNLSKLVGLSNEGAVPDSNQDILYSVPLTVTITDPKTVNAIISDVHVYQDQIKRAEKPYQTATFEHITPGDGRLMVVRASNQTLTWYNESTHQYQQGFYDTVYSVAPEDSEPCDITQWTHFYPISHAPYHDIVKSRYDFAAFPFRDPMGHIIRDGDEFKGTYPWIDSKAKNLSMTILPAANLYHENGSRYATRCVINGCDENALKDQPNQHQGLIIMGAWTQGKAIQLDGVLNDIDFELPQHDERHSYAKLYQANTGILGTETGEVRLGSTRQVGNETAPIGTSRNTTIFDSVEARFNYQPEFLPLTPKDVVWLASSGRNTDEFAFDDYLNPNAFIISNMVGAVNFNEGKHTMGRYYDGWNKEQQAFIDPVYIQNSSTALREQWITPDYGQVHNGRLEPAALGGVRGKGIWLDGENTFIEYDIPSQPRRIDAYPWFVGLFLDKRSDIIKQPISSEQSLISFPDGSELTLLGNQQVLFRNINGQIVNTIVLPEAIENKQWHHLAMNISADGKKVRFYQNGFPIQEWITDDEAAPIFQFSEGALVLGKSRYNNVVPFKGWVDEFKVYADNSTMESVCNHAHGTLIALEDNYIGELSVLSDQYSAIQNSYVSRELVMKGHPTFNRYQCYTDNTQDYGINPRSLPEKTVGLGHKLNFPEGPLLHDAPRPDSRFNQFCLTCHNKDGGPGLTLEALRLNENLLAKEDPRRQPLQAEATIYGNIPANWLDGSPDYHQQLGQTGALIDEWLLASANNKEPEIKGFTLVSAETGEDILPIENGMILDLADLRTSQINIRAVANGLTRQVSFSHNGVETQENEAPFALFSAQNNRYNSGTLNLGSHTLTATAGNSEKSIQFTVIGNNHRYETGTTPVLIDLEKDNTLLSWIINTSRQIMQLLADLFNTFLKWIPDSILNFILDLFGLENPYNLDHDVLIMIDSAIRDGHTVSISGRVIGKHTGVLNINQQTVNIHNNHFDFQQTTDVNKFSLVLFHENGRHKETIVNFDQSRVSNGVQVRLGGQEGIYSYVNNKIEEYSPQIENLVNSGLTNINSTFVDENFLGINISYLIKSASVNGISSDIYPSQVESEGFDIDGSLIAENTNIDSYISAVGWCFNYPSFHWYFWGVDVKWHTFCPINYREDIAINLNQAEIPFTISIIPGVEANLPNQLLALKDLQVSANFNKSQLTIGWFSLPEWLSTFVTNTVKDLFLLPELENIKNDISTNLIKPKLALLPNNLQAARAARVYEVTKIFDVVPDSILPAIHSLLAVEFSVDHMKTDPRYNQIGLDVGIFSLTSDNQVHYGYRSTDDENKGLLLEDINYQADAQFLLQGTAMNKALATFAQENLLSTALPIELNQLLQMDHIVDGVNNELNTFNQFDWMNLWPDIQFPYFENIEVVLAADFPSAPYVKLPKKDDTAIQIHVDNVHFALHTPESLLNEYKIDEVITLLDLNADLVVNIDTMAENGQWQTEISLESANLVSINTAGINIPQEMVMHLLSRITQTLLPEIFNQIELKNGFSFDGDIFALEVSRPDLDKTDLLVELSINPE